MVRALKSANHILLLSENIWEVSSWAFMISAARDILVHAFWRTHVCVYIGNILRTGITGSWSSHMLSILDIVKHFSERVTSIHILKTVLENYSYSKLLVIIDVFCLLSF